MKKTALVLLVLLLLSNVTSACTVFIIQTAMGPVFGRNLDWFSDRGILVVNQRNVHKTALVLSPEQPAEWVSAYGSISFCQFGKEFPFGGMNEKGLVVENLTAPVQYERPDSRPSVNELQWIQYQLDNYATTKEVIEHLSEIRIRAVSQGLHYMVCDSSGHAALIEFVGGRPVVYTGDKLSYPVAANDLYSTSLHRYKQGDECRFATAADKVNRYKPKPEASAESVIEFSFNLLDSVAITAEWSMVYDIPNRMIYFRTSSTPEIKYISLQNINFSCEAAPLMFDLQTTGVGWVNEKLVGFSTKLNGEIIDEALAAADINIPKELYTKLHKYHKKCKCAK